MAKVTYLGFHKEPDEGSQKAYEILTGRNLKPFLQDLLDTAERTTFGNTGIPRTEYRTN